MRQAHTPTQRAERPLIGDQASTHRRWSVNGRFLARNVTGVDRYAREILRAMDALIGEGHPLAAGLTLDILCPAGAVEASPFVNIPMRHCQTHPATSGSSSSCRGYVRGGLLSLCNTGPLALKRQIVCIHDLNSRITPESYGLMFRAVYRVLIPALGRRAAQIVTVSRFSQKTIDRFGIRPADEIEVIHDGYEHVLDWNPDRSPLTWRTCPDRSCCLLGAKHHTRTLRSSIQLRRNSPPEASTSWLLAGRTPTCMRASTAAGCRQT